MALALIDIIPYLSWTLGCCTSISVQKVLFLPGQCEGGSSVGKLAAGCWLLVAGCWFLRVVSSPATIFHAESGVIPPLPSFGNRVFFRPPTACMPTTSCRSQQHNISLGPKAKASAVCEQAADGLLFAGCGRLVAVQCLDWSHCICSLADGESPVPKSESRLPIGGRRQQRPRTHCHGDLPQLPHRFGLLLRNAPHTNAIHTHAIPWQELRGVAVFCGFRAPKQYHVTVNCSYSTLLT